MYFAIQGSLNLIRESGRTVGSGRAAFIYLVFSKKLDFTGAILRAKNLRKPFLKFYSS